MPVNDQGATLAAALQNTLSTLCNGDDIGRVATLGIYYGSTFASAGGETLTTYVPIGLSPHQSVTTDTGSDIQTVIEGWQTKGSLPPSAWRICVFAHTLYSDMTAQTTPLLELNNIISYQLRTFRFILLISLRTGCASG